MKRSIKDYPKKRPGRPATGKDPMVGVRMSDDLQEQIRKWAANQDDHPPLATAVRRLVEIGLKARRPPTKATINPSRKKRAAELAAQAIDGMVGSAAQTEEAANRKRRLLKGPEEFLEVRVDGEKKK
jgi:hypothetical protein